MVALNRARRPRITPTRFVYFQWLARRYGLLLPRITPTWNAHVLKCRHLFWHQYYSCWFPKLGVLIWSRLWVARISNGVKSSELIFWLQKIYFCFLTLLQDSSWSSVLELKLTLVQDKKSFLRVQYSDMLKRLIVHYFLGIKLFKVVLILLRYLRSLILAEGYFCFSFI